MKRRSPLAAVFALPCLILAPLPAHAAAVPLPNTVAAIMARIAQGGGVTLTQHGSSRVYGGYTAERRVYSAGYTTQAKGRLDLADGGVSGADVQRRLTFNAALRGQTAKEVAAAGDKYVASLIPQTSWHRWISVKGWLYGSGAWFAGALPQGKTWARAKRADGPAAVYGDQLLNLFEPATLKALITEKNRKGRGFVSTGPTGKRQWKLQYAGALSFDAMSKLSPTFRDALNGKLAEADRGLQLNWSVFVDRKGLPLSVSTFWRLDTTERFFVTETTTDYVAWSTRPSITAPPSGRVAVTSGPTGLPETDDDIDVLAARPATR